MKRLSIAAAAAASAWLALGGAALAQSNPGFITGQVPTATQWNGYFTAKQDALTNSSLLAIIGSPSGFLFGAGSSNPTGYPTIPGSLLTYTPPGQSAETLQARGQLIAYLQDYGASGSTKTVSGCSITGGTASLICPSNPDFANGEGVLIPNAEQSVPFAAPSSVTATSNITGYGSTFQSNAAWTTSTSSFAMKLSNPGQVVGGETVIDTSNGNAVVGTVSNWTGTTLTLTGNAAAAGSSGDNLAFVESVTWSIAALDPNGGETAATAASALTNVSAFLASQQVGQTVTLAVTPGFGASFTGYIVGNQLYVSSVGSGSLAVGQSIFEATQQWHFPRPLQIIAGTSSPYTLNISLPYTVASSGSPEAMTSGPEAWVVYRKINSGTGFYVNTFPGSQTSYVDTGFCDNASCPGTLPYGLSATPPASSGHDWCVRTIASGGGTNTMTLSSPCPTTVGSQLLSHDDTAAINACIAAQGSTVVGGGACRLPCWNDGMNYHGTYQTSGPICSTTRPTRRFGATASARRSSRVADRTCSIFSGRPAW